MTHSQTEILRLAKTLIRQAKPLRTQHGSYIGTSVTTENYRTVDTPTTFFIEDRFTKVRVYNLTHFSNPTELVGSKWFTHKYSRLLEELRRTLVLDELSTI